MSTGIARDWVLGWVLAAAISTTSCSSDRTKAKYLASGNQYYARGMYEEARTMYIKAIQADRMYGEAYYRAGLTAVKLQRWEDASRNLRIAVDLQPKNEDAYARLADVYSFAYTVNKNLQPALLKELEALSVRIHDYLPGTYSDERIRAYVELFSGDSEGGLASLDRANRIRPHREDVIVPWVQTLMGLGRVNEANNIAAKALDVNPSALRVYDVLVAYYIRNGHPDEVERVVRLKVRNNPKVAAGHLELAAQAFASGDTAGMKSALLPIMERSNDFPDGPLLLGDFYLRIRDWKSAEEQYRRGLAKGSKNRVACQKRLLEVLAKQGRHTEALQLSRDLVKETPTDPEAIAIRASLPVLAEDKDRIPEAIADFQAVIGRLPEDFVLRYTYGRALLMSGKIPAAIQSFKEALQLQPDYIWPRVALAFITLDAGRHGDALSLSRSILADEGRNVPFDTAGQRPQERPFYDEVLGLKPASGPILRKLAKALAANPFAHDEALAMSRRAREDPPAR